MPWKQITEVEQFDKNGQLENLFKCSGDGGRKTPLPLELLLAHCRKPRVGLNLLFSGYTTRLLPLLLPMQTRSACTALIPASFSLLCVHLTNAFLGLLQQIVYWDPWLDIIAETCRLGAALELISSRSRTPLLLIRPWSALGQLPVPPLLSVAPSLLSAYLSSFPASAADCFTFVAHTFTSRMQWKSKGSVGRGSRVCVVPAPLVPPPNLWALRDASIKWRQ